LFSKTTGFFLAGSDFPHINRAGNNFHTDPRTMNADLNLIEALNYWLYQVSAYLLMHVMDDPAWLALIFC